MRGWQELGKEEVGGNATQTTIKAVEFAALFTDDAATEAISNRGKVRQTVGGQQYTHSNRLFANRT